MQAPDLTARPLAVARRQANALGIALELRLVDGPGRRTVVAQRPAPGEVLDGPLELDVSEPSWMRYLPAIHQGDGTGLEPFLARFMRGFQQMVLEGVTEPLEAFPELLNPETCPDAHLPWLARFAGVPASPDWPAEVLRRVIAHSAELRAIRGTAAGLARFASLVVGRPVTVHERTRGSAPLRVGALRLGRARLIPRRPLARVFTVTVDADPLPDDALRRLHDLISAEKPAWTSYELRVDAPAPPRAWPAGIRLDTPGARLGIARLPVRPLPSEVPT